MANRTYAERERSLTKVLAELHVTRDEASLFHAISYGVRVDAEDLPGTVAGGFYPLGDSVSEASCRAALTACLVKGWLQVVDDAALADIAARLPAAGFVGPVCGLPRVGQVDFTAVGAGLWVRIRDRDGPWPQYPFADVVRETTAEYFTTFAAAEAEAESARGEDDVVAVSDPCPTGPWRAQWWRRFPAGYRIDVEQRRQWQGRSIYGCEECDPPGRPDRADSVALQRALDARNVTLAQYVVLAAMESGPTLFDDYWVECLVEYADTDFVYCDFLTEDDCRAGMDACLRSGWVRVLDAAVIDEVRALVRGDSAVLALPRTAELRSLSHAVARDPDRPGELMPVPAGEGWGKVDFTPAGATLYRAISAAWRGDDWEDALRVSNGYSRDEHRYCVAESGFRDIVAGYEAEGRVVRSARVVPIGPWCVYWWEQFPAGFRLELEVGG